MKGGRRAFWRSSITSKILSEALAALALLCAPTIAHADAQEEVLDSGQTVYSQNGYVSAGAGNRELYSCAGQVSKELSRAARKEYDKYLDGKINPCRTDESPLPRACRSKPYEEKYNAGWAAWNKAHPDAPMPENLTVITLVVPSDKKLRRNCNVFNELCETASTSNLVNLYIDPKTNRVVSFTSEHRSPPGRPNPSNVKVCYDPRLKLPNTASGKLENLSSPDCFKQQAGSLEELGQKYDELLNSWINRGEAYYCPFAQQHNKAVAYAADPNLKDIDGFLNNCKGEYLPAGCGEEENTGKNAELFGAVPGMCDASEKKKDGTCDFNLMFNRANLLALKKSLLRTQVGIISSTLDAPGIKDFVVGPTSPVASWNCGGKENLELANATTKSQELLNDQSGEAAAARYNAEVSSTITLVSDLVEARKYDCHVASSENYGASVKDDRNPDPRAWMGMKDREQARLNSVLNRSHVLGLVDEGGESGERLKLYRDVMPKLRKVPGFDDVDFSLFESHKVACPKEKGGPAVNCHCLGHKAGGELVKLKKKLSQLKKGSPAFDAIVGDRSPILKSIREAKLKALKNIRKSFDKFTRECDKAGQAYDYHMISDDDGMDLWRDEGVIAATVAEYKRQGRMDLVNGPFCEVYRANRLNLEKGQRRKAITLGVAAAALMVVPVVGEFTTSAAIGAFASAATTGLVVVDVGMAAGTVYKTYNETERNLARAEASYGAGTGSHEGMEQVREEARSEYVGAGMSLVPAGIGAAVTGTRGFKAMGGKMLELVRAGKNEARVAGATDDLAKAGQTELRALENADDAAAAAARSEKTAAGSVSKFEPENFKMGDRSLDLSKESLDHARAHFVPGETGSKITKWSSPEEMFADPNLKSALEDLSVYTSQKKPIPADVAARLEARGIKVKEYVPERDRLVLTITDEKPVGLAAIRKRGPGDVVKVEPRGPVAGVPVVADNAVPTNELHLVFGASKKDPTKMNLVTAFTGEYAPPNLPRSLQELTVGLPKDQARKAIGDWYAGELAKDPAKRSEILKYWKEDDLKNVSDFWSEHVLMTSSQKHGALPAAKASNAKAAEELGVSVAADAATGQTDNVVAHGNKADGAAFKKGGGDAPVNPGFIDDLFKNAGIKPPSAEPSFKYPTNLSESQVTALRKSGKVQPDGRLRVNGVVDVPPQMLEQLAKDGKLDAFIADAATGDPSKFWHGTEWFKKYRIYSNKLPEDVVRKAGIKPGDKTAKMLEDVPTKDLRDWDNTLRSGSSADTKAGLDWAAKHNPANQSEMRSMTEYYKSEVKETFRKDFKQVFEQGYAKKVSEFKAQQMSQAEKTAAEQIARENGLDYSLTGKPPNPKPANYDKYKKQVKERAGKSVTEPTAEQKRQFAQQVVDEADAAAGNAGFSKIGKLGDEWTGSESDFAAMIEKRYGEKLASNWAAARKTASEARTASGQPLVGARTLPDTAPLKSIDTAGDAAKQVQAMAADGAGIPFNSVDDLAYHVAKHQGESVTKYYENAMEGIKGASHYGVAPGQDGSIIYYFYRQNGAKWEQSIVYVNATTGRSNLATQFAIPELPDFAKALH